MPGFVPVIGPEPCTGRDRGSIQERRRVLVTELEGGTLTSSAGDLVSLLVRLCCPFSGVGVRGTWWCLGAGRRHAVGS